MARTGRIVACTIALLLSVGTIAVKSQAQSASGNVADDVAKKSQEPGGASVPGAPGPGVDSKFQSAPALFRQGKFAEAERQFAWIAEFRKGTTWGERSQYYVAECQFHQKKYFQAFQSFERLHTEYPATDYIDQLVRREYEIAQLWNTLSKPKDLTEKNALQGLAFLVLCAVRQNNPTGPLADDATIQIADYYMNNGDYDAAAAYYDQFLIEYRKSPLCPRARRAAVEARSAQKP